MRKQQDEFGRYALVLVVAGALGRLVLMHFLHPFSVVPPINNPYFLGAQNILRFNFHALGERVPVYPLFVALCGLNLQVIWVAQSALGIGASVMIYEMAYRRTRNELFSFLVGITCSLIPELLDLEASVDSEVLSNFLIVTSFWVITRCEGSRESKISYPLGLGIVVALMCLHHPLMICLAPVYYCFLVPLWPPGKILRREAIKKALAFALPALVSILGWCVFNYFNSGYFTPTTLAGPHLIVQVDPYVDLAPDRFAVLRDAWAKSRYKAEYSPDEEAENVYWALLPGMERRTGKTAAQVSHEYASLALYLEIHHPLLCLRRAEQGWIRFWGMPGIFELGWPPGNKVRMGESLMAMVNFSVREVKAAFLVLALLSIPCALLRPKAFTKIEYLAFALVLWASVFQAFGEFGDRRYCIPFYMLIIWTVSTRVWVWITATSMQDSGATPDWVQGRRSETAATNPSSHAGSQAPADQHGGGRCYTFINGGGSGVFSSSPRRIR